MVDEASASAIVDSIQIDNMVGSTSIGQELDLEPLANDLDGVDYNLNAFPGLVFRTDDSRTTVLIFRTGKIVVTGATSRTEIDDAVDNVFGELADLGIRTLDPPEISIVNIVSTTDLGERLNLNSIAIALGLENVEYEPEQFPGLIYRLDDPAVVVLLFGSGKLVVTAANQTADTTAAVEHVVTTLEELGLVKNSIKRIDR